MGFENKRKKKARAENKKKRFQREKINKLGVRKVPGGLICDSGGGDEEGVSVEENLRRSNRGKLL